jgi:hypothetical protein
MNRSIIRYSEVNIVTQKKSVGVAQLFILARQSLSQATLDGLLSLSTQVSSK